MLDGTSVVEPAVSWIVVPVTETGLMVLLKLTETATLVPMLVAVVGRRLRDDRRTGVIDRRSRGEVIGKRLHWHAVSVGYRIVGTDIDLILRACHQVARRARC